MLHIGFTKKYYTLWNVVGDTTYDGEGRPSYVVHYTFIQNLSIDKDKAIKKAKEKFGVKSTEVDTELYGRNGSWSSSPKKLYSDLPNDISPFFEFGKMLGRRITDNKEDVGYIKWYHQETNNRYCQEILLDLGELVEYNGMFLEPSRVKYIKSLNEVKDMTEVITTFEYNLRGLHEGEFEAYGNAEVNGVSFEFHFPKAKYNSYRGFEYFLPMKGNVGKRIKNKELKLQVKFTDNDNGRYFEVIDWDFN